MAYSLMIEGVFFDHRSGKESEFYFERKALDALARSPAVIAANDGKPVSNLGDVLYAFRSRRELPDRIIATQPPGLEWTIELAGRARYRFKLATANRILPRTDLITIPIPDSTPEIIAKYALNDEQALLAKVRYSRLIDIFLGITAYSLQNHLRTSVVGVGQIEIDELYVGIDKLGRHFIVPVQAKGGKDKLTPLQSKQDIAFCRKRFPKLQCRAVSAQFMTDDRIAMFELKQEGDEVKVVEERHYKLVQADQADPH
ncbi:MAG: endonuclease [Xanthomonadaceae bacterium]|nr:endonuclease [Xanthomonadaceae bacterium]MDP2186832.1 endonuclease [Xanthomonadales bacterium]MDZ4114963.1 endonuclease [Xanthomonadaceae bacterium]MDZ4376908.1 endonuclease [Xanthomonadaceae bacterium]